MEVEQPDKWSNPLSKIFNSQINSIAEDMFKFMDEHPDFDPSEPHTSPPDRLELQRCGRYPFCRNYITDKSWERYGVCSALCDSEADAEIDRIQQA